MFLDTDFLKTDDLQLLLEKTVEADQVRGWVPAYHFAICGPEGRRMGVCDLRVGHNRNTYFGGNIGYRVEEPYRGHHYAGKACLLLFQLARRHGMDHLFITCNPDNLPSRRTCEYAGGQLVEVAELPEDNDMRLESGETEKCVYRFDLSRPTVALRSLREDDAPLVRARMLPNGTEDEALAMIRAWNTKEHQGRYFEIFAVTADGEVVGTVSLYHHSPSVVSDGPEIFPEHRRRGYAAAAVEQALAIARGRGYTIALAQIEADNAASIALHKRLGFETDGYAYLNRKGRPVLLFLRSLL